MLKEVILSRLTDQFYEIKNLIYEKFLIFITYLSELYDLAFIKLKTYNHGTRHHLINSLRNYINKY